MNLIGKSLALCVFLGLGVPFLLAQQPPAESKPAPPQSKVRVYVADSQSWEMTGGWGASHGSGGGGMSGGARPQTAEIFKTFRTGRSCSE